MNLSKQQEKFCLKYHETGNATQSYLDCYATNNERVAAANASRLLTNANVASRMQELKKQAAEAHMITVGQIIKENARLAFQDLNKVLKIEDGALVPIDDEIDLMQLDGVTISNSESDGEKGYSKSNSFSIKLSAKVKALQELARLTGAYDESGKDETRDRESNADSILESLTKFKK